MKKHTLSVPLLVTAALAPVIALNLGCGQRNSPHSDHRGVPGDETNLATIAAGDISVRNNPTNTAAGSANGTNTEITTPPAAVTTMASPATPDIAPSAPADKKGKNKKSAAAKNTKVVEMSVTPPVAPDHFYNGEFATNHMRLGHEQDYYFTARAGYQHAGYGDNGDTWYGGFKFYAYPDMLRARAGKNAWLIPDVDAELSHQILAKPDRATPRGSDEGLQLRVNAYWPWVKWSTDALARENSVCPFAGPMHFTLGPVFAVGFDKTFDGSSVRLDRYGGARLAVNRSAFIQYAYGKTDGIGHDRHEILGELPFYTSRDGQVSYVFRGEWSRGDLNLPDYYQLGAFIEMPLDLLVRPRQWHDLIPFAD